MKNLLFAFLFLMPYLLNAQANEYRVKTRAMILNNGDTVRHFYTIMPDDTIISKSYVDNLVSGIDLSPFLTEENDPVFTGSPAYNILQANIDNWITSYNWGDHDTVGYLKQYTETDPVVGAVPGAIASNGEGIFSHASSSHLSDGSNLAKINGFQTFTGQNTFINSTSFREQVLIRNVTNNDVTLYLNPNAPYGFIWFYLNGIQHAYLQTNTEGLFTNKSFRSYDYVRADDGYRLGSADLFLSPLKSGTAGPLDHIMIGQGISNSPAWINPSTYPLSNFYNDLGSGTELDPRGVSNFLPVTGTIEKTISLELNDGTVVQTTFNDLYQSSTSNEEIIEEVPTGSVNGVNKTFIVLNEIQSGTAKVFVNGQRLSLGRGDYTVSGNTITLTVAPLAGAGIWVDYLPSGSPILVPSVTTANILEYTSTTALMGGEVLADNGSDVIESGVVYNTTGNPTILDNKVAISDSVRSFSQQVTGLTASTTYYVKAYGTNGVGTAYGNQVTVTTNVAVDPVLATVLTNTATNITETSADVSANIADDGDAAVTARGIVWSTGTTPTLTDNVITNASGGTGSFSATISGLTAGNTYYYRGYATNSVGTSYGNTIQLITASQVTSTLQNKSTAWWELDETSGTTLVDEKSAHAGTIGAGVTINQTGAMTQAHSFSGGTDSYNVLSDHNDLTIGNQYAFSFWLNPADITNNRMVAGKLREWFIDIDATGDVIELRQFHNGTTAYNEWRGSTSLVNGNDYHVVINIVDNQNRYSGAKIYVNGSAETIGTTNNPDLVSNGIYDMRIGSMEGYGDYEGKISQFIQFSDSLSSSEVAELYNSGNGVLYDDLASSSSGSSSEYEPTAPPPDDETGEQIADYGTTGDYFVSSSTGNDSNNGTSTATPWATLNKVNSTNFAGGADIKFKAGDSWIGTLIPSSSGASGSRITYGAYDTGLRPKIYGSKEITGWTVHSGNIYKATFSESIEQLFLDDEKMLLARYPNTGYHTITNVNSSTQFSSSDLSTAISYTGATWVGRTSAYTLFHKTVTSSSSQTITLESSPTYTLNTGEGFFLANKLAFLDQAGEWYYDSSTNTVYLWTPDGDTPGNYTVRGSTENHGVYASGKDYITVENLSLLQHADIGVYVSSSDYLLVDNCRIINSDLHGIYSTSSGQGYTHNYIVGTGGAIRNTGGGTVTITDNYIREVGLLSGINKRTFSYDNYGTGIYLRNNNPTVQYNKIFHTGYNGINWRGLGSIKYNYLDSTMSTLGDGGSIYTYNPTGGSSGSEVMYNIVRNSHGNREGDDDQQKDQGHGIYMDNGTSNVTIQYNTIDGAQSGVFLHDNGNTVVQYNTIYDALLGQSASGELSNSYFYDNDVVATDRVGDHTWWSDRFEMMSKNDGATPVYDRNNYYHAFVDANADLFSIGGYLTFTEWKSQSGQDGNSTLNTTSLNSGETQELFYNTSKSNKTFYLNGATARNLDGSSISGSFVLEPFRSKVVRGTNLNLIASEDAVTTVPNAPTNLTASAGNATVSLSWTGVSSATSYSVKRATTSGGPYTTLQTGITSTSWNDNSVTNGTTYYYVVSASNSEGESTNSSQASATPNATASLFDKAIAVWDFDEASGTVIDDATTNNLDLTLASPLQYSTLAPTNLSRSIRFNSSSDTRCYRAHDANLSFPNPDKFSFSMWINIDYASTDNYYWLASKTEYGVQAEYYLAVKGDGTAYVVLFENGSEATEATWQTGTGVWSQDVWHNFVFTYDGGTSSSSVKLYIDNVEVPLTLTGSLSTGMATTTSPFYIGSRNNGVLEINAYISQTAIFNDVLTSGDRSTLWGNGGGTLPANW